MVNTWFHYFEDIYNTNSGVGTANGTLPCMSMQHSELDAVTNLKNFRLGLFFTRLFLTRFTVCIVTAPNAVFDEMQTYGNCNSTTFWEKYGKYIWAHQSFVGGNDSLLPTQKFVVEIQTGTPRKLEAGDTFGYIIYANDLHNNTAGFYHAGWYEYDLQTID